MIHEITDENFEAEVANSPLPCLIEFTGNWCTLCDEMLPALEALSERYADTVRFCTVNTDENRKLRIMFAVAALPYVVWVHDGMKTPLFDELAGEERLDERIRFMLDGGQAPTTVPLGTLR